jgi:c-di-GMP-related signal transduction protein
MTLKDLLTEAKDLDIQEQVQLATQLLQWVEVKINRTSQKISSKKLRQAGIGLGSCIFKDNFDDPLSNEFWLGES